MVPRLDYLRVSFSCFHLLLAGYILIPLLTAPAVPAPPGMLYPFIAVGGIPVLFDLRKDPRRANRHEFERHDRYSLFSQPVKNVRLVCKDFPWPIEIKDEWVVCGTIWEKVYNELQVYITESEWALASEEVRRRIDRAVRFREAETGNRELRPRRIDWLGEKTLFAGLERDNAYVQSAALPGKREMVDTWVIRLDKPR